MNYFKRLSPVERKLTALTATRFSSAMEGMDAAVADCEAELEALRAEDPEAVERFLEALAEEERRRDTEALAEVEAMAGPRG